MIANRFVLALLCAVLLAAGSATNTPAQTVETTVEQAERQTAAPGGGILDTLERIREAQSQQLEGSWDVIITPAVPPGVPQPPSFHAYSTYARGGAGTGSDRTRPFSKQHLAWTHLGGNSFAVIHKEDLFDGMGNFAGIVTVRVRLTVTGKDEYVGVSNGEARDAAGNLIFSRCATIRGTRIKVEPLPDQCQSITPPQ